MTTGAVLTAALLAGPAAVTAEAHTPETAPAVAAQTMESQAQDDNDDGGGGGWGLWGLLGLFGLLGLIPRGKKKHDTGGTRGTGTGGYTTDRP
ncbi:WGxxGxxG family protein [Streptomyces sp. RFCAC02]|uniref:WGxxGxxG family protein n=1 Tax=Streptomyces sp. RFCAC02 TaxID=2499143 RepID=UPI00101F64D6|nr:WGxxGxxG family protein [Streptomyces sp. RFCAC02]